MSVYKIEIELLSSENIMIPVSVKSAVSFPVEFPNGEYEGGWTIRVWKTRQEQPVAQFMVPTVDPPPGTLVRCSLPDWAEWGTKEFKIGDKVPTDG